MDRWHLLNRRHLIARGWLYCLGVLTLNRCGTSSSGTSSTPTGNCNAGGTVTYTNPGHAHSTNSLSATQVSAGTAGTYTLMGGSHSHTFTLTAADFTTIQNGGSVSKTDLEGDGHTITIAC